MNNSGMQMTANEGIMARMYKSLTMSSFFQKEQDDSRPRDSQQTGQE